MSRITIEFELDNDAFQDELHGNIAWTLKRIADDADNGDLRDVGKIYDLNGNSVGEYRLQED